MKVITDISYIDKKKWWDFVASHPNGNIFQTPEMYNAYRKTPNFFPIILVCQDEDDDILGLLLALIQKEYKGVFGFFSARSIIFGGPLVLNNNINVLNYILCEYQTIIKRKVIYSQFRNFCDQGIFRETFTQNKFVYKNHLNIILDLSKGESTLFENFSKSRKKGIKKALKEEFVFDVVENVDFINEFYKLLSNTYNKIKLPFPNRAHFYKIYENLNSKNFKMFSLSINGEAVVALFALIYNNTIYGYYLGSKDDPEILRKKPIDLFFWKLFNWSINNKIIFFDWMGAGTPDETYGVRDFKLQFGGKLVSFGRYEKIHKPTLYFLGKLGLKIWQKLP
jgi:serine/alanine adding enzyme